jgi:hypothetical protein
VLFVMRAEKIFAAMALPHGGMHTRSPITAGVAQRITFRRHENLAVLCALRHSSDGAARHG